MERCNLCPRQCNADGTKKLGFCLCGKNAVVSKYMLHHWEEPPISGTRGSGAVFFSGCTLKCVFCQNREISRTPVGEEVTPERLGDIFLELKESGAHNINLVTPTQYTDSIITALELVKHKLNIPVVYNTSGYESVDTLKRLKGLVDVYLPDFKYYDRTASEKYSRAPDYFDIAVKALDEMFGQTGAYAETNDGIAKKGVIVRHLVLPGLRHDSVRILEEIKKILPIADIRLSLMSQFTPVFVNEGYKELTRKITTFEYNFVLNKAIDLGYVGFFQQKDSATASYTPNFSE